MNYTIRIKRQENPQASPCWQEFTFEGSADTSIASDGVVHKSCRLSGMDSKLMAICCPFQCATVVLQ